MNHLDAAPSDSGHTAFVHVNMIDSRDGQLKLRLNEQTGLGNLNLG
jgi:hypothetical protein